MVTDLEYAMMDQTSSMTTQEDHAAQEQTKVLPTTLLTEPTQQEIRTELSTPSTSMTETTTEPVLLRTYSND